MEKSASQVLREAKTLIGTPEKWCSGGLGVEGENACMLGAILLAEAGTFKGLCFGALGNLAADILERALPSEYRRVPSFNNAPGRTHAEVMEAFDRAIQLAEADERKEQPWTLDDTKRVIEGIVQDAQETTESGVARTPEHAR